MEPLKTVEGYVILTTVKNWWGAPALFLILIGPIFPEMKFVVTLWEIFTKNVTMLETKYSEPQQRSKRMQQVDTDLELPSFPVTS
jgi:hypothetical protein